MASSWPFSQFAISDYSQQPLDGPAKYQINEYRGAGHIFNVFFFLQMKKKKKPILMDTVQTSFIEISFLLSFHSSRETLYKPGNKFSSTKIQNKYI